MIQGKRMLVVSAHAADYVWRGGGSIAKYIKNGANVHVVVLSFGVHGESNDLWRNEGATYESVKQARKEETAEAAKILGITHMEFWDLPDYPINPALTDEVGIRMIKKIREVQPDIILTHDISGFDVLNPDHNVVSQFIFECSVRSNSSGIQIDGTKTSRQMQIYGFEPHQTELSRYVPGIFVDITETYEQKVAAMNCFKAQSHLIEYYTQRASMRGNHARRLSGCRDYQYAESFQRVFPVVGEEFI